MELVKINSKKTVNEIVERIKKEASTFNFILRDVFNMGEQFKKHDVSVSSDFEYYSIMVCNPEKAYKSIILNPLRGAVLLPPKQIVVYRDLETNSTTLAYLKLDVQSIKQIMPGDVKFQKGLEQSCNKIVELMNKANE